MMRGKWKRVSPRGIRPVDGRKKSEENEKVRGIYTLLYSNRAIDQEESAANEGYRSVAKVRFLKKGRFRHI